MKDEKVFCLIKIGRTTVLETNWERNFDRRKMKKKNDNNIEGRRIKFFEIP